MQVDINLENIFLEEDTTIADAIKITIIQSVSNQLTKYATEQIKSAIDEMLKTKLDAITDGILENFVSKPITVSDGYKSKNYENLPTMVEEKMSAMYKASLNSTGSCGKDPLLTKLHSVITNEVKNNLDKINRVITMEGAKIAREEIAKNTTVQALQALQIQKETE